MSYAAKVLASTLRRLVLVQVVLAVAAALIFLAVTGRVEQAAAVLYGGGIVILGSLLSGWRLARAAGHAGSDPKAHLRELYIGFAMRFVVSLALLAVGMGLLWRGDAPAILGIVIGFAVTQFGYAFNRVRTDIGLNK